MFSLVMTIVGFNFININFFLDSILIKIKMATIVLKKCQKILLDDQLLSLDQSLCLFLKIKVSTILNGLVE